jgi:hypothetical protein
MLLTFDALNAEGGDKNNGSDNEEEERGKEVGGEGRGDGKVEEERGGRREDTINYVKVQKRGN